MTTFPLRRLRLRSGEEHREPVSIALEPFELGGQRYLPIPGEVDGVLEVQRGTSGDMFRLSFETRLHGPCMRCLRDAVVDIAVDAREYHALAEDAGDELRSEYVVDDGLQLSQWARDAIATALPEQVLCREDCAGLCPVCGENLNDAGPDHAHERAPDPRWAALDELKFD